MSEVFVETLRTHGAHACEFGGVPETSCNLCAYFRESDIGIGNVAEVIGKDTRRNLATTSTISALLSPSARAFDKVVIGHEPTRLVDGNDKAHDGGDARVCGPRAHQDFGLIDLQNLGDRGMSGRTVVTAIDPAMARALVSRSLGLKLLAPKNFAQTRKHMRHLGLVGGHTVQV